MPEGGERTAMPETVAPELVGQLEAILFASDAPLPVERIAEVLEIDPVEARAWSRRSAWRATRPARGLAVVEVGGGVRLVTRPEHAPVLMSLQRLRAEEPPVQGGGGDARRSSRTASRSRGPRSSSSAASGPRAS